MLIQRITNIGRTYRHLQRYTEILSVLFKFGFDDMVTNLRVEQYLDFGRSLIFRRAKPRIEGLTRAVRLRMVLEELGPTFIKLGQMLSTRADILPNEFIEELTKLQENVPPYPFSAAMGILNEELKGRVTETFPFIDPEPLAAASIGQVHRARLAGGEDVVVKIQRPGIQRIIEADLEILMHLATLMEKHLDGWEFHRPTRVVEEFGRSLENELDYGIEAANMEALDALYARNPVVCIPKVYRKATTSRILTMDYVDGIPAGALDRLIKAGYDPKEIARMGAVMVMEQTMKFGFFHADPHPGNLFILPGPIVCMLDFGMVGRLDRKTRERIADLVTGVIRHEPARMAVALLRLTEWEEEPDRRALEREVTGFLDRYLNRPLKELNLGRMLQQVFEVAVKFKMRMPPDLLLLIKALSTIEGLGKKLDPDFDIISAAKPFIQRIQLDRLKPKRVAGEVWEFGNELFDLAKELPQDMRAVMKMFRRGKVIIELEHHGLEKLRITLERGSNRLAFAVVLAALIIGSSVVVLSGIPPTWHGIPLVGLAGFIVAGIMGFWLLITILRRGMM